ncbi:unnamed protein product [Larinioides sclopetarius]|uniref:Uncharacterized protein n=1 Tax=Larinioides sclopetarius TaxID=280406 RepID=A0AAV1ZDL8_9ARAC
MAVWRGRLEETLFEKLPAIGACRSVGLEDYFSNSCEPDIKPVTKLPYQADCFKIMNHKMHNMYMGLIMLCRKLMFLVQCEYPSSTSRPLPIEDDIQCHGSNHRISASDPRFDSQSEFLCETGDMIRGKNYLLLGETPGVLALLTITKYSLSFLKSPLIMILDIGCRFRVLWLFGAYELQRSAFSAVKRQKKASRCCPGRPPVSRPILGHILPFYDTPSCEGKL